MPDRSGTSTSGPDIVSSRRGGVPLRLARGRWAVEIRGDEVADIRFDDVVLLRAVRPVVRDRDWNTVPVRVLSHHLEDADPLTLTADLVFEGLGIAYAGSLVLELQDRELLVRFDGRPLADFERNRIGLVVLHPPSDAGQPLRVWHSDDTSSTGSWPTHISPHQPFQDVQGFGWAKQGLTALLTLIGDTFETEDQRNWTDASFKTYSTPLSLPFPVHVRKGEQCHQEVRLSVSGDGQPTVLGKALSGPGEVLVNQTVVGPLPPVSLSACLHPLASTVAGLVQGYESLLVELTGGARERWRQQLVAAAGQAREVAAGLDVRIVTSDPGVLENLSGLLADLPVVRLGVFDADSHITTSALWQALRGWVERSGFTGQLVGGTRAHFTELNRQIDNIPEDIPTVTFSITPQMHASEIPHIIDSLPMQRLVAENATRLVGGRPILVGPITLARRFNAVATSGTIDPGVEAERAIDPLQHTGFAAAWTLGSLAQLAAAQVAGVSYFETMGPRGVVSPAGEPTPTGALLNRLATMSGQSVTEAVGPEDLAILPVDRGAVGGEVFLGNLSPRRRTVAVRRSEGEPVEVELDGWSLGSVQLPPARFG
jgi:D-apionolactonase